MLAWLLLHACAAPDDTGDPHADSGGDSGDSSEEDTGASGPCPPATVQVGDFCVDAWETTVTGERGPHDQGDTWPESATTALAEPIEGVVPSVGVSWYQAVAACANAGKHLCTVAEWQAACGESALPWGTEPPPDEVCALPAPDSTTEWTELQPTGSLPDCRSPAGVFDQIGNAWEWADPQASDDDGLPIAAKVGGAYYAGPGNGSCAVDPFLDHPPAFDGTISARCCVDAR